MDENQNAQPKSNMTMYIVVGAIGLLLLGGIGIWMVQNSGEETSSGSMTAPTSVPTIGSSTVPSTAPQGMSEVRTINLEAGSFYYKPKEIRVKKGETVRIVMTAADMMHDFNIDELGVKMPITRSGNTGTVEFTADEEGEFEYYCSVANHRQQGQTGTLIVE